MPSFGRQPGERWTLFGGVITPDGKRRIAQRYEGIGVGPGATNPNTAPPPPPQGLVDPNQPAQQFNQTWQTDLPAGYQPSISGNNMSVPNFMQAPPGVQTSYVGMTQAGTQAAQTLPPWMRRNRSGMLGSLGNALLGGDYLSSYGGG